MPKTRPGPTLFSYVVARDYGFAPNPWYGFCTLATCKPNIRRAARVGDWIVGTGSKTKELQDQIVYAMRVSEVLQFDEYWRDERFLCKRPNLHSSIKKAYGDNIYHRNASGAWQQADSHHSYEGGQPNCAHIQRDTRADWVLISDTFAYWGRSGPTLPSFAGVDIRKKGQNHKCKFSPEVMAAFISWFHELPEIGVLSAPGDWKRL